MSGDIRTGRGENDFRAEGELAEYLGRLMLPGIIVLLLAFLIVYGIWYVGVEFIVPRMVASSFFVVGMAIGAVIELIILRVYTRWRFFNQVIGRSMIVSEKTLPEIHRIATVAAGRLGVPVPGIYVVQDPQINAYAMGVFRRIIIVNTGLIDVAGEEELMFILGHEMAHVKYGWSVPLRLGGITLPIPLIVSSQRREYTCDRGGLIACRNLQAAVLVLLKLAMGKSLAERIDVDRLYRNIDEARKDRISRLSEAMASHPPIKNRILQLRLYEVSAGYRERIKK